MLCAVARAAINTEGFRFADLKDVYATSAVRNNAHAHRIVDARCTHYGLGKNGNSF